MSKASSEGVPRFVVTMPPVPKPVSSSPWQSWRVSAKSMPPLNTRRPAVTMRPSFWIRTASAFPAPTGVDTRPPLPNVASSPGGSVGAAQWTATLLTLPWSVPWPLLTVQTWSGSRGCVLTRTS